VTSPGGGTQPASQLIFHSFVGQLCLTTPLEPHRLREEVRLVLNLTRAGEPPAGVVARLFARVSLAGGTDWVPELSQVSWDLPGLRVSFHSDSNYVLAPIGVHGSPEFESIELASPDTPAFPRSSETAGSPPADVQIVLQSMLGDITVVCNVPRSVARDLLMEKVSDTAWRQRPSAVAGSILHALWQNPQVLASMEIDLGYPQPTPDTLWLRHLSGETYAYAEGAEILPAWMGIVGRTFMGPHLERHLQLPTHGSPTSPRSEVALEDALG